MAELKTSVLYRQTLAARIGRPAPAARQSRLRGILLLAFVSALAYQQTHVSGEMQGEVASILMLSIINLFVEWRRSKPGSVAVTSLEDRADFTFGRSFDDLSPEEQKQLLEKYQVSTFYMHSRPFGRMIVEADPREQRSRRYASLALCLGTLPAAGFYWAYMVFPTVPLLQVLGSSRSDTFLGAGLCVCRSLGNHASTRSTLQRVSEGTLGIIRLA